MKIIFATLLVIILSTTDSYGENLAEKLGYSKDARVLIIHGDDHGMNGDTNKAMIDLYNYGLMRSSSVMLPCPNAKEAIEQHPNGDLGIHLTFNSEWDFYKWGPVAAWMKVWSLVNLLKDPKYFVADEVTSFFTALSEHLEQEGRAQIQQAIDWGLQPTHIDSHMGTILSKFSYGRRYLKLAKEFEIPPMIPRYTDHLRDQLPEIIRAQSKLGALYAEQAGFLLIDWLILPFSSRSGEHLPMTIDAIKNLKPGVTHFIIHPAYLKLPFSNVQRRRRNMDAKVFQSDEIRDLIEELDIKLIGWKDIQAAYDWSKVNPW